MPFSSNYYWSNHLTQFSKQWSVGQIQPPLPVVANKAFSEHSHIHSFIWLAIISYNSKVEYLYQRLYDRAKPKTWTLWSPTEENLLTLGVTDYGPMQFSKHWTMDLPKPDLSPRQHVCEWPILAHPAFSCIFAKVSRKLRRSITNACGMGLASSVPAGLRKMMSFIPPCPCTTVLR